VCGAHLFVLPVDTQACLESVAMATGRNDANFFSAAWHG
jgi:hypothetical protein